MRDKLVTELLAVARSLSHAQTNFERVHLTQRAQVLKAQIDLLDKEPMFMVVAHTTVKRGGQRG